MKELTDMMHQNVEQCWALLDDLTRNIRQVEIQQSVANDVRMELEAARNLIDTLRNEVKIVRSENTSLINKNAGLNTALEEANEEIIRAGRREEFLWQRIAYLQPVEPFDNERGDLPFDDDLPF